MQQLPVVYVADLRYNGWKDVPPAVVGLPQLVVLNAGNNAIESVGDGEWWCYTAGVRAWEVLVAALGMPIADNNAFESMGDGACCCQLHPL